MTKEQSQAESVRKPVQIECGASPSFEAWLSHAGGSVAVTTYQAGKVALIGWDGRQLTLLMRQFEKPMGIAFDGNRLALATRLELTVLSNAPLLAPEYLEEQPGRYDALFLPRVSYYTGDVNIHDVAFVGDNLIAVNTRFSCLAKLSSRYSFEPLWRPSFVSDLVPEDRCHLNGLAVVDGRAKYVTALGTTDIAGGWRENKAAGGVLMDVESNEIILEGLSMPHSPRWYDGRLWLLDSGRGELCVVDIESRRRNTVCQLPGYLRGLCFVGPFALVGLSRIREKHIFGGLPIQDRVKDLSCGVAVVDVRNGQHIGLFEFTAGCEELFEIRFLPNIYRPMIVNRESQANRESLTNPESSFWLRPSKEIPDGPTEQQQSVTEKAATQDEQKPTRAEASPRRNLALA